MARQSISRVLSFLQAKMDDHSSRRSVAKPLKQPTRGIKCESSPVGYTNLSLLFGLAPGGVYPATFVTKGAVRSYRTISPLPE